MALVVEPTLPYTNDRLQLGDPRRWSRLLPLMRASLRPVETSSNGTLIIDTSLTSSHNVLLAAVGTVGNFSSRILSDSHLAAFTTQQKAESSLAAKEILNILESNSFPTDNGIVVVKSGGKQTLERQPKLLELVVVGELQLDHVLSLLSASTPETLSSLDRLQELLEKFVEFVTKTSSTFHPERSGKGPTVRHTSGDIDFNSAKQAVEKDLGHLLDSYSSDSGDVVYSIHYADVNGLSRLETNILAHEIYEYFNKKGLLSRISHSTILDNTSPARGWSISLCALSTGFLTPKEKSLNTLASNTSTVAKSTSPKRSSKLKFSDPLVRKIITAGCESVIKDEPTITEYDTIVGDGDCGYTLRDGATQVLSFISGTDLSTLPSTLSLLVDDLEVNMGGTSGGLYCIFLSALAQHLWEAQTFPEALKRALDQLMMYTKARLGDRTCMDCLIPFVETLRESGDAKAALEAAGKGVESTKQLEATLGRSSYLDESATRGVPDPGAYGLMKLLEGMVSVT